MPSSNNGLLASLPSDDFDLLEPQLKSVRLGLRKISKDPKGKSTPFISPLGGLGADYTSIPAGWSAQIAAMRDDSLSAVERRGDGTIGRSCLNQARRRAAFQSSASCPFIARRANQIAFVALDIHLDVELAICSGSINDWFPATASPKRVGSAPVQRRSSGAQGGRPGRVASRKSAASLPEW